MKKYILASAFMITLISCKTKMAVENPISTTAPVASSANFFSKINEKTDFQQLKINSRIIAETGKFIPPLDATIYIEKDQKVWINMVAIFLNVGRAIATPQGIKGYEKWNKTYIESDFSYLNSLLNVNFIDYGALQNLLLGKTFIPVTDKDFKLTKNAQGYLLTSEKNLSFQTNGKISQYSAALTYNNEMDLENVSLQKIDAPDQLEVSYSNWENFENMKLPKNVKIIIKGSKNSQILLENTKFESLKMEAPYSVPNNYTKTEIK
ncbi:DUF4292 domain-containing protein [Chryseobacterium gotjawalense]|uniref:DUF4292 domain-containing protein n=1 Tax=Chryseobacterium gotjawalense TaxID=3042315 RepID=A0ABY8RBS5_9FLAO|nr:DUF4292 domain-containing protein [Chryseobacterium sp. wdc7]WHF50527.1 DUF4292 domain-containing protein [Chryseobacterium sp. wdc7]